MATKRLDPRLLALAELARQGAQVQASLDLDACVDEVAALQCEAKAITARLEAAKLALREALEDAGVDHAESAAGHTASVTETVAHRLDRERAEQLLTAEQVQAITVESRSTRLTVR